MKNIVIVLISFLLLLVEVNAQNNCDYIYTRQAIDHVIKWNPFRIDLQSQLRNIGTDNKQTSLLIDSSNQNNWIIFNNHTSAKNELYELTYSDSIKKEQRLRYFNIIDKHSNQSFNLMVSAFAPDYYYLPDFYVLNNQIVFFNINRIKKHEIVIFDTEKKITPCIETKSHGSTIGRTDTSIIVLIQDQSAQIDNQKYKQGEIVSISKNGVFRLNHRNKLVHDSIPEFYNGTFAVFQTLTHQHTENCTRTDYSKNDVYVGNRLLDSIKFQSVKFELNDIPVIGNNRGRLTISNQSFFKVYTADGLIYSWDNHTWADKIEVLKKSNYRSYLLIGDTLFIVVETDLTKQTAVLKEPGITLNNLPVDKNATDLQTILMFNITRNEFIEYPTIIFTGN